MMTFRVLSPYPCCVDETLQKFSSTVSGSEEENKESIDLEYAVAENLRESERDWTFHTDDHTA